MAITMKEIECKLDELRRENFSLKLRLYMIEKSKNGNVGSSCYFEEDIDETYANSWTQTEILKKTDAICQTENDQTDSVKTSTVQTVTVQPVKTTKSVAVQCEMQSSLNNVAMGGLTLRAYMPLQSYEVILRNVSSLIISLSISINIPLLGL